MHPFCIPLPPSFAKQLCSSSPGILPFALFFHPSSTQFHQTTVQLRSCHSFVCTPLPPLFHPTPPNDFTAFNGFLLRALHPSLTQQLLMGLSPACLAPLFHLVVPDRVLSCAPCTPLPPNNSRRLFLARLAPPFDPATPDGAFSCAPCTLFQPSSY